MSLFEKDEIKKINWRNMNAMRFSVTVTWRAFVNNNNVV